MDNVRESMKEMETKIYKKRCGKRLRGKNIRFPRNW